jgi:hypothetical protein
VLFSKWTVGRNKRLEIRHEQTFKRIVQRLGLYEVPDSLRPLFAIVPMQASHRGGCKAVRSYKV